jgi:hypothetical protein
VKLLLAASEAATQDRRRWVITTLALALCLFGCGSAALQSDGVRLVIDESVGRIDVNGEFVVGCGLMPTYGELIADPTFGVAFKGTGAPAVWPRGTTGWRVGTEVEVRDALGRVMTTTGIGLQQIHLAGNGPGDESGAICSASHVADHLQPSSGEDQAP